MQLYRYYNSHGQGEAGVAIRHTCGHAVRYDFGGTADYFREPRQRFSEEGTAAPCPDCRLIEGCQSLPPVAPIRLRILSTEAGEGWLTPQHPGATGVLLFVRDDLVLVQQRFEWPDHRPAGSVSYTYATRLFGPPCCYLHRFEGIAYTPEELAWVDEYVVRCHTDREPDSFHRYYHFGASFKTAEQLTTIQERLAGQGRRLYLSSVQAPDGRIIGEEEER